MLIRYAAISDLAELAALLTDSVQKTAPPYYTPAQVTAWATTPANSERFRAFILEPTTFVAVTDRIVGFAGVTPAGYVASLYVHGDLQRQGIGSRLLSQVLVYAEQQSIDRLYTEASRLSRPLFEKFGFVVYGQDQVERNGVWFERDLMQRCNPVA